MKKIILIFNIFLFTYCIYAQQLQVQYRTCLSCDTTSIGQNSSTTIYQYGPVAEYEAVKGA